MVCPLTAPPPGPPRPAPRNQGRRASVQQHALRLQTVLRSFSPSTAPGRKSCRGGQATVCVPPLCKSLHSDPLPSLVSTMFQRQVAERNGRFGSREPWAILSNLRHVTGGERFPAGHPVAKNQRPTRLFNATAAQAHCSAQGARSLRHVLRRLLISTIRHAAMRWAGPYLVMTRAGGCQVPSPAGRMDGGVSLGQYRRITR